MKNNTQRKSLIFPIARYEGNIRSRFCYAERKPDHPHLSKSRRESPLEKPPGLFRQVPSRSIVFTSGLGGSLYLLKAPISSNQRPEHLPLPIHPKRLKHPSPLFSLPLPVFLIIDQHIRTAYHLHAVSLHHRSCGFIQRHT